MSQYRSLRDFDWPLLIIVLILCSMGILQIYSATFGTVWRDAWWKQIMWVGAGVLLMWIMSNIDYHTLLGRVPTLYVLSILTLMAVFLVGRQAFGSRRWIPVGGGFHFQVSEFVKLVIVLLVARYLTELKGEQLEARDLWKLGALVGFPMLLIILQPDLGTALTYIPILAAGVFLAGPRWKHVAVITLALVLAVPIGWRFFMKDYQKDRLVSFMDPSRIRKVRGIRSSSPRLPSAPEACGAGA